MVKGKNSSVLPCVIPVETTNTISGGETLNNDENTEAQVNHIGRTTTLFVPCGIVFYSTINIFCTIIGYREGISIHYR